MKNFIKLLYSLYRKKFTPKYNKSYSQSGEDMILKTIFAPIKKGTYVDVGANDPFFQSNTQFFYNKGWNGINIDANPKSINRLKRRRKRDINIEALISDKTGIKEFCFYKNSAYNHISDLNYNVPSKLLYKKQLETKTLNSIIEQYNYVNVEFLSIDVEGADLKVLKSINFETFRPKAIIIESFSKDVLTDIASEITLLLKTIGYVYFCRTSTNTIYIESDFMRRRFKERYNDERS